MTRKLPAGFELLNEEKRYINVSQLPNGEHKFRIVQAPIAGWEDWENNKPLRFRPEAKPKNPVDAAKPIRAFWALYVWDYQKEGLYVMSIKQNTIRHALQALWLNEDWGELTTYDIKIKKEGSGIETNYTVTPIPHKPLAADIKKALADSPVRLEALYDGGE